MTEKLRSYTPEQLDLLIQFDNIASIVDVIRNDREYLDNGGHLVFFNSETDRSLVVDRKIANMLITVASKMFSELLESNLFGEAEDLLTQKREHREI